MKLCMFSPKGMALERGWPGRVEGDTVIQLAAQTLQAFFSGGGSAREHARYPLAEVELRPPVRHPPSIRVITYGISSSRFAAYTSRYCENWKYAHIITNASVSLP